MKGSEHAFSFIKMYSYNFLKIIVFSKFIISWPKKLFFERKKKSVGECDFFFFFFFYSNYVDWRPCDHFVIAYIDYLRIICIYYTEISGNFYWLIYSRTIFKSLHNFLKPNPHNCVLYALTYISVSFGSLCTKCKKRVIVLVSMNSIVSVVSRKLTKIIWFLMFSAHKSSRNRNIT